MKITDVETIVIQNIQPYRGGRYWLFVQLITDLSAAILLRREDLVWGSNSTKWSSINIVRKVA